MYPYQMVSEKPADLDTHYFRKQKCMQVLNGKGLFYSLHPIRERSGSVVECLT